MNWVEKIFKDFDLKVAKRIKEIRIKYDVPQEKLGKYIGVSKQAISKIEHGKRKVSIEELEKIALFFDVPLAYFVKYEYRYVYPLDYGDTSFSVFMTEFIEEYIKALSFNPGKKNIAYMSTDKFIKEIKHLKTSITEHRLFQQKQRERKEKEN